MIKEVGLKDHDYYGFGGPKSSIIWYLDPLGSDVHIYGTVRTIKGILIWVRL